MSADARAVVIRRKHVVGTDGDHAGVTDFHLAVKLDQTLGLALILRAVSSPAKHKNHGIWPLQIGELATLARMIRQLIVGKYCASYNVRSHNIAFLLSVFPLRRNGSSFHAIAILNPSSIRDLGAARSAKTVAKIASRVILSGRVSTKSPSPTHLDKFRRRASMIPLCVLAPLR